KQWTIYNKTKSPIPHPKVPAIAFDKKGTTVWIGTGHGLCSLKGKEFKVFKSDSSSELPPEMTIYSLAIDKKGILWVGYKYGGVASYDGHKWTLYTKTNSGLPDDMVYSICVDKDNIVWIGTLGSGLARFNGHSWKIFNSQNSGLVDDNIMYLTTEGKSVWIATLKKGLFKFSGE
ncbi:MAG: two-component regulator propeller domain-containing protein, partial [Bacteroidota bacterium]|nr:two-component regulator propeller domain-containing protein [Bacteroidota bacterium]